MTQRELADRLVTSESTISNLEREQHRPIVPDQVNGLIIALRLSAEELLSAMGVNLTTPAAARLPHVLVSSLLRLSPDELDAIMTLAMHAAGTERSVPNLSRAGTWPTVQVSRRTGRTFSS